jgi:outer membrane receptor protein involved in Fe transport
MTVFAAAQTAAAVGASSSSDKTIKLDKYIVTGSNIPTTETAAEARTFPVQTIDQRAIEQSGLFNTSQLLQTMVLSNGGSVPLSNNATGFTPGASSTSLRGLGPEATLVLINGRRVAPFPVGSGGDTAFVDLNSIPLNAIERVEVLKDGASATYGADAIAGVVNIILKNRYDGTVATLSYGNTTNRDSTELTASILNGVSSEKGSLTVGVNYQHRNPIFNRDRDYSAVPPFLSSNSSPANFSITRAAALEALGLGSTAPLTINGVPNTTSVQFIGSTFPVASTNNGTLPASAYTFRSGTVSRFNFNEFSGSFPEWTRKGLFGAWEREFFSPNTKFYGDAMFQDFYEEDQLAPLATGFFRSPGSTTLVIPARTPNPILTPFEQAQGTRTAVAGAYNPFNPFNQDLSDNTRMRLAEFGNRTIVDHNRAFAFTSGLRFENVAEKFNVDLKARYSLIQNDTNHRLISVSRLNRIMNAADSIFNPSSPDYIGTTTPYNPFGYFRNPIPSNSIPVNYALAYQRDQNRSTMVDFGALVNSGALTELAAGGLGFAFGADFRREAISQQPDSALQAGDIAGSPPASPINRQRKVASVFTEFEVPIFSDKHTASMAHSLSLNVAARYESFLTSKNHTFVPKIGLRWAPNETLVFRSSWGKGFREASLYQLYAGAVSSLNPITINTTFYPQNNPVEPEMTGIGVGNANLKPEKSDSINFGAVWTPTGSLEGFTFAVDFWRISRTNTVSLDFQDTIDRSVRHQLHAGEEILLDASGAVVAIRAPYQNQGDSTVRGVDINSSYIWKTEHWGRFQIGTGISYLDSYKLARSQGGAKLEYAGEAVPGTSSDDAYVKWKAQSFISWTFRGVGAQITNHYTSGFNDISAFNDTDGDGIGDPIRARGQVTWDAQVQYTLFASKGGARATWWSDLKLVAGCRNFLDRDPPHAEGNGGNSNGYPGFLYTDEGRFVYASVEKKF